MRIGIIAPPWVPVPPPAYGGTEMVVDLLARGLVAAGNEVLLFASGDSTCPVPRKWVIETTGDVPMGAVYVEMRHIIHAYDAMRDFDIVYDHTFTGLLYSERFPDLRVVTMSHNQFDEPILDIYRRVTPRVPIIAISHKQASLSKDVPIAKVIHHGVEVGDMPFGEGDGGFLLYLARMAPWKGAHRAAAMCREAGVPLKIAAKMRELPEKEYFESEVKPLLGDDIEFLGEVNHDEKLELLPQARALINPIRWNEPFGLAPVEALACGTPVLTYAEGASPEIVDDGVTGFICKDEADMVAKIGRIDEIDRKACREAAETRFTSSRMIQDHMDLFEFLLSR